MPVPASISTSSPGTDRRYWRQESRSAATRSCVTRARHRRGRVGASCSPVRRAPAKASGPNRDDTPWLQARLDRGGGTIFLPKLPDGKCYATRGLWVSHDDTTINSDGACVVSLGLGPVRLHSIDGDPIASSAVFFVNRSDPRRPAPVNVKISKTSASSCPP